MTDSVPATSERARELMRVNMPSFDHFLAHVTVLKGECEKAGGLTPARELLFDSYRDALVAARGEYEDRVAACICDHFTAEEVELLIAFYGSPIHHAVEKVLGLSAVISNIGTLWQTQVLETLPDCWKMIMDNVGEWQRRNMPEDSDVITPETPPDRSGGGAGWRRVDLTTDTAHPAEEYIPSAPEEEAEIARIRAEPETVH